MTFSFTWEYYDKTKQYCVVENLQPKEFYDAYVKHLYNVDTKVSEVIIYFPGALKRLLVCCRYALCLTQGYAIRMDLHIQSTVLEIWWVANERFTSINQLKFLRKLPPSQLKQMKVFGWAAKYPSDFQQNMGLKIYFCMLTFSLNVTRI